MWGEGVLFFITGMYPSNVQRLSVLMFQGDSVHVKAGCLKLRVRSWIYLWMLLNAFPPLLPVKAPSQICSKKSERWVWRRVSLPCGSNSPFIQGKVNLLPGSWGWCTRGNSSRSVLLLQTASWRLGGIHAPTSEKDGNTGHVSRLLWLGHCLHSVKWLQLLSTGRLQREALATPFLWKDLKW